MPRFTVSYTETSHRQFTVYAENEQEVQALWDEGALDTYMDNSWEVDGGTLPDIEIERVRK